MRQLIQLVADRRDQLEALLAGSIDYDRFITVSLQAVQSKPELLACSRLSLLSAIRDAATYGVEPVGMLGDAAIIPRRGEAKLELEYRGLRKLALRDGTVAAIDADVVYQKDEFRIESGTQPTIIHRPEPFEDRGSLRGAYAWARFTNGELVVLPMSMAELMQRRQESQSWKYAEAEGKNDSVWHKWPVEMMKKTVLRRLILEKLPMSARTREAIAADTLADVASPQSAASVLVSRAPAGEARQRLLARMGMTSDAPAQIGAGAKPADQPASQPDSGRPATQTGEVDADSVATDSGRPGASTAVEPSEPPSEPPKDAPAAAAAQPTALCGAPSPYVDTSGPTPKAVPTCRKLAGHVEAGDRMHRASSSETWE